VEEELFIEQALQNVSLDVNKLFVYHVVFVYSRYLYSICT